MSLLGIDLGTSGVRAAVFRLDGTELASRAKSTAVVHARPGIVETDAEAMLAAVEGVLRELADDERLRNDPVSALAISVQGEAVVPVDAAGRALAPAPLSMDRRGAAVFADLARRIPPERLKHITGQPAHPMFSIYKIGVGGPGWHGAQGVRCLGDFVAARLGAEPAIDYSMAARTGAFDLDARAWSDEILAAASESAGESLTAQRFSRVVASGTVIGAISPDAATRTGLRAGTPIVAGAHDQASSFVGGGGAVGARSVFAFGSSDCLSVATERRPRGLDSTGFATYPLTDSVWISLAGTAAGGWALTWFAELVGADAAHDMDALFARPASEPPRLLVLPYFAGSGTLDNDPGAHGVIAGLTLSTTVPDLSRAFLESSGFELAKILDALRDGGIEVGSINAVGGGVRNRIALAIRADAAGVPLTGIPGHSSARGAAMTAGIGIGEYGGLDDVPGPVIDAVFRPTRRTQTWYDSQRSAFRALYQATRPINTALSTDKE